MKSAIYATLSKVTGLKIKKGQDVQEFLAELVKAVANLKDADWESLSAEEQDWYNDAASAKNKKQDIALFPDLEKEEEDAPRGRRRASDAEEDADKTKAVEAKVGSEIVGVTARGKTVKGVVTEIDGDLLIIDDGTGGDLIEFNPKTCKSLDVVGPKEEEEAPRKRRRNAEEDDEPKTPELKKGDKVVAVTKRGKTITGTIDAISDDEVSIDDGEEIWDFEKDRLESLLPAGGKANASEEEAPRRSRTPAAADAKKEEPAEKKRASNGDVSIGTRIRELIAEDFDITMEAIGKALTKEKIEFKENTLSLNYKESMKFIEILKKAKRLK